MGTNHRYSEKGLYRDQINRKNNSKHAVVELPSVVDSTTITYSGKYNDYDNDDTNHVAATTLFPTHENLPTADTPITTTSWTRTALCRCFWSFLKPTISTGALLYFTYILLPGGWRERSVWYMSFFALNALHQILVAAAYLWTEYGCCCWLYCGCDDEDEDEDGDDFPNNTTNPTPPLRTVVGFTILLGTAGSNALVYLFLGVTCLYNDNPNQYDEYRKVRLGIVWFSSMALLSTVYHAVLVSRSSALCRRRRSNN